MKDDAKKKGPRAKRMRQATTKALDKSFGHKMGGLFGVTPKKPEPDMPPRTRAKEKAARNKRLSGLLI